MPSNLLNATSSAGDDATSSAGDDATSSAGDDATSSAGDDATSSAGDDATSSAGDDATSSAGDDATSSAGDDATSSAGDDATSSADDGDTFPRAYVEQLRNENKQRREALDTATAAKEQAEQQAQELATALFTARARLDGRLAEPDKLAFDGELSNLDPAAIEQLITEQIAANPRLSSKVATGDIGQGHRGNAAPVNLIGLIRGT